MIEQLGQIARETSDGESLRAFAGASMSTAIVGENIGVNGEPGHDPVPDARVERQGVDQDDTRQVGIAGRAQRISDRAVVRGLENTLVHSGPRYTFWMSGSMVANGALQAS